MTDNVRRQSILPRQMKPIVYFMPCSTDMLSVRVMVRGVLNFRSLSGLEVKINILQKSKYRTKKLICVWYENVKNCVKKQIKNTGGKVPQI